MKKIMQIFSLVLTLSLVLSIYGTTAAFADSASFSCREFGTPYQSIELWDRHPDYITVYDSNITLSATSSDESVVGTEMVKDAEQNRYILYLSGYKNGKATVTVTASDGSSVSNDVIVDGNAPYSISSDTTQDFSLAKGNSYIMKIHLVSLKSGQYIPPSIESDNENIIKATILDWNADSNNNYFFRIDTIGSVGQSATLSIGGLGYIHNKTCKVTIKDNKDLRLDTTVKYTCDVGATYRFIAYTSSKTVPAVSTDNGLITAKYEGKVTGGYLYSITSLYPGDSSVHITSNGESASFPVSVNLQKITSDTPSSINVSLNKTYVYKLKVTGNKEPTFTTDTPASLAVTSVRKEGGYYYVKVTTKGTMKGGSFLIANFPAASNKTYPVYVGFVNVADPVAPAPKSDTTTNVQIPKGSSYTFKITNSSINISDAFSAFKTELVKKDGYDSYYKITAVGSVGSQSQVMMYYGNESKFLCWVSIGNPPVAPIKSDTTYDFSVKQGSSYIFKLTSTSPQLNFYSDNGVVFKTSIVSHSGNDYYCKITATGAIGSTTAIFASIPNSNTTPKKLCSVTVA